MRKISVNLDPMVEEALESVMDVNKCSLSDVINAAILAYALDSQPSMCLEQDILADIKTALGTRTVDQWCAYHNINKQRLRYVIRNCAKGATVAGFGNTKNKWRDKQDGRLFKTHTAWIAHCLKEDFNIDIT